MLKNLSKLQRQIPPAGSRGRYLLYIIVGFVVAAIIALAVWWTLSFPAVSRKTPTDITIEKGESARQVADTLETVGLIRNANMFLWYVEFRGWTTSLEAGDYLIPANVSLEEIAYLIATGIAHNDVAILIPEGSNIWQIDDRLANSGLVIRGQFAKAYYLREGHLFPDTYRFRKGSTMAEIDKKMEDNFNIRNIVLLGPLSLAARDRIITIASIIEKESLRGVDMQLVAGVIENRVKRGMPLQIDATVMYGACLRNFQFSISSLQLVKNCDVTQVAVGKEIHVDSAFNSYTRAGYPPRAISNPGAEALNAVLNPKGNYLYYLSTRDGSQMIFSKTGAEHTANRKKYLGL